MKRKLRFFFCFSSFSCFFCLFFGSGDVKAVPIIERCGTYYAEGTYLLRKIWPELEKTRPVILLEKGSWSEITFVVNNREKDLLKLFPHPGDQGGQFAFHLNFTSSCAYQCQGKILKILEKIDFFKKPRPFIAEKMIPLKGTEIPCQKEKEENPGSG